MKIFKRIVAALLLVVLIVVFFFATKLFPIISGFGAKQMCSCVMLGERQPNHVVENELKVFPLSFGSYSVDFSDSSAYGSVMGLFKRKAIYRKGLGCTLVVGVDESELRQSRISLKRSTAGDDIFTNSNQPDDSLLQKVNKEKLAKVLEDAFSEDTTQENRRNLRAVVVVYRDKIIGEHYAKGFTPGSLHLGWSMAKSAVNNPMVGLMVRDSLIKLESNSLFKEWEDDDRREITVNNLLQMMPGLQWDESYGGESDATIMLYKSKSMAARALASPLTVQPGTTFHYSSGTANLISELARRKLGDTSYYSYVYANLFDKIGAQSFVIEPDASGTFVTSSYAWATARDWAKLGLLYTHDGTWNGERILPEGWISYTNTPCSGVEYGEYGGQFWLNAGNKDNAAQRYFPDVPTDMFWADGFQGQRMFIVPSKQLVVVNLCQTTGNNLNANEFLKEIINCL